MDALPVELELHIASLVGARPRTMHMVLADDGYTHPYNQEVTVRRVMGGEVRDGTIRAAMTLPPHAPTFASVRGCNCRNLTRTHLASRFS